MTVLDYIYNSFIEFLKKHDVLTYYDEGIQRSRGYSVFNKSEVLSRIDSDIINWSFCWSDTPIKEGKSWRTLNAEWSDIFPNILNLPKSTLENISPITIYYTFNEQISRDLSKTGYLTGYTIKEFNSEWAKGLPSECLAALVVSKIPCAILNLIANSNLTVVLKELDDSVAMQSSSLFESILSNFDSRFKDVIFQIRDVLPLNYIDVDSNTGKVSYLLKDKIKEVPKNEFYTTSKRTTTTIGKLLMKLDFEKVLDKCDIERISNYFRGIFRKITIEVLEGEDIKMAYLEDNYAPENGCITSTLHRSCMRHSKCQSYFDFYIAAHAKIAVLFNEQRQIEARALLWEVGPNKYYLDRIYSITPFIHLGFVNAVKSKYDIDYYRIDGKIFNAHTYKEYLGGLSELNYSITSEELKTYEGNFPYVDSLYIFIKSLGMICTPSVRCLHDTYGGYSNL